MLFFSLNKNIFAKHIDISASEQYTGTIHQKGLLFLNEDVKYAP
jgi:hypothetical protein